jgi:hypothetical protein
MVMMMMVRMRVMGGCSLLCRGVLWVEVGTVDVVVVEIIHFDWCDGLVWRGNN